MAKREKDMREIIHKRQNKSHMKVYSCGLRYCKKGRENHDYDCDHRLEDEVKENELAFKLKGRCIDVEICHLDH